MVSFAHGLLQYKNIVITVYERTATPRSSARALAADAPHARSRARRATRLWLSAPDCRYHLDGVTSHKNVSKKHEMSTHKNHNKYKTGGVIP